MHSNAGGCCRQQEILVVFVAFFVAMGARFRIRHVLNHKPKHIIKKREDEIVAKQT